MPTYALRLSVDECDDNGRPVDVGRRFTEPLSTHDTIEEAVMAGSRLYDKLKGTSLEADYKAHLERSTN